MPSIRFRLDKPSLTGLAARVAAEYGPEARILDTEESIVGGIGGLFGRKAIDVLVEVPDRAAPEGAHEFSMPARVGLAALLDDADAQDFGAAGLRADGPSATPRRGGPAPADDPWASSVPVPPPPAVSTQGGDFASVLDALRIDVEPAEGGGGTPARPLRRAPEPPLTPMTFTSVPRPPSAPAGGPVPPRPSPRPLALPATVAPPPPPVVRPAPLSGPPTPEEVAAAQEYAWATPTPRSRMGRTTPGAPPPPRTRAGDLLLLVGLGDDAVRVATALRDRLQTGYVCDGGTVEGNTRRRVDDRRGAVAARAYGVRSDQPVIVAYGLDAGEDGFDERHAGLLSIDSDQAWLVVDASRPAAHTLGWTGRLRGRLQVDAVASVRTAGGSLDALAELGLPEAYRELAS